MSKLYVFLSPIAVPDVENVCVYMSKMYVCICRKCMCVYVENVCENVLNTNTI